MMNVTRKLAIILGLLGMSAALAGCAVEALPYPKLSGVKKFTTRILSRGEQEEAIRGLTAEQEQHQKDAIREIEKPQ